MFHTLMKHQFFILSDFDEIAAITGNIPLQTTPGNPSGVWYLYVCDRSVSVMYEWYACNGVIQWNL